MKRLKEFGVLAGLVAATLLFTAQAPVQICIPTKNGTQSSCSFGVNSFSNTALTNTVATLKATPGVLGYYHCYNPSNAVAYLQFFNVAGNVTLNTTVPNIVFGTATLTATWHDFLNGVIFTNAIKVAATTTPTGATAPSSALVCAFGYK